MSPVIDKQQFENQSGGWVGAVVIGPKGDETGVAVEPDGTVWLSEAEQILTANASRKAEDNPFLEQSHRQINPETGEWETVTVTPLVPIQRDRYIPANERPIPSDLRTAAQATGDAQVAATADEPSTVVHEDPVAAREAAVLANPPVTPPKAAAAAEAAAQTPQSAEEPSPPPVTEPSASAESTAAESTGAAAAPTGPAPEGGYAAGEEVGTPGASEQTGVSPEGEEQPRPPAQQPAPWTPQNNQ